MANSKTPQEPTWPPVVNDNHGLCPVEWATRGGLVDGLPVVELAMLPVDGTKRPGPGELAPRAFRFPATSVDHMIDMLRRAAADAFALHRRRGQ